jgi:hypothetical protein
VSFTVRAVAGTSEVRAGVARDASSPVPATGRDAVVRPFGAAVRRPCARPNCSTPAIATLTFRYTAREAWIERLLDDPRPQSYDLCARHAARTRPPHGWQLHDRRPEDERYVELPSQPPADLGDDRTVAVLAAALRAVPDAVSEDAVRDDVAEAGAVPAERATSAPAPMAPTAPTLFGGSASFSATDEPAAVPPATRPPLAARARRMVDPAG